MPRPVILDVHEWTNEILTVPGRTPAKPQTRERASEPRRGKKTLLSLTPARGCLMAAGLHGSFRDTGKP